MKVCAVVSEFNPFHNGHKYLLGELRNKGFDAVICIMSGNFVQRGEYAVCDKRIRAGTATDAGADLVLSLPFPWSSATAELFAKGAISIADSLGCVDAIGFGSECGDIDLLSECADFLVNSDRNSIADIQKNDPRLSFAQARSILAKSVLGERAYEAFARPNDILAIEYLKALKLLDTSVIPYTVKREEASHDGSIFSEYICSSSKIRELIKNHNQKDVSPFVPWNADELSDAFVSVNKQAYFNFLRGAVLSREPDKLSDFAENGGGFEYALYREMLVAKDYDELVDRLGSRHLTDAKIRRALMFTALGVKKEVFTDIPQFTEVLSCTDIGKEVLKICRKTSRITILSKTANIRNADDKAKEQFKLQRTAEIAFETLLDK